MLELLDPIKIKQNSKSSLFFKVPFAAEENVVQMFPSYTSESKTSESSPKLREFSQSFSNPSRLNKSSSDFFKDL